MKTLLVITPNYPYKRDSEYPFVKNLCDEFAKKGWRVTVLSPQSLTSALLHRKRLRPRMRVDETCGYKVTVYQPYSITPSYTKLVWYNNMIRRCALRFLKTQQLKPDVCYCHFWCSAYFVLPYMLEHKIPMFVASGESEINLFMPKEQISPVFRDFIKGVICVSSKNQEESVALGLTTEDKCSVFPNAVNPHYFHLYDKNECRKRIGAPQDAFIVAFVGWLIERKGPKRVAAAISKVGGVNSLFVGKGDQDPQCEGILYKGPVAHNEVPIYLGAADCFVLPTLHEGCCNAIIEAMACGLPVISSNLPFNWDVLDEGNSIMVDPNNVDEIADAIRLLKDNPDIRERLSMGALKKAESLTINKRAESIISFIEKKTK